MSDLLLQEEIFQVIYGCSLFLHQNKTEYISIALNEVFHYNYLFYLYSLFSLVLLNLNCYHSQLFESMVLTLINKTGMPYLNNTQVNPTESEKMSF